VSSVEKVLLKFEHVLPSTNIRHLVVTRAMADDPAGELQKLLQNPEDPEREACFQRLLEKEEEELRNSLRKKEAELAGRYGLYFSEKRIDLITRRTAETRADVDTTVEEVLAVHQAASEFEKVFSSRNEVQISFTEEAIDRLVEKVWQEGLDSRAFFRQSFQNYEHGLKLIEEKTGRHEFSIPPEGVENPENYLNSLIKETYKGE